MGHLGGVIVCIPLSLSPLTTFDSYLCSVPSCLGLDSLQLFSPITMANRPTVDSAFIISPLQGHLASPAPSTINDWQFPLHYSPTAASLHRLTSPIKGRCLRPFSPHLPPSNSSAVTIKFLFHYRITTVRALVRHEMGSPGSPLSFPPSPVSSRASEQSEAELRCACHRAR
jgi:hypothetical protein